MRVEIKYFHPTGKGLPNGYPLQKGGYLKECLDNFNAFDTSAHSGGIIVFDEQFYMNQPPKYTTITRMGNLFKGKCLSDNGAIYGSKSICIEINNIGSKELAKIAEQLCDEFLQETVLLTDLNENKIYLVSSTVDVKAIMAARKGREEKCRKLFYSNIVLLWESRNLILNDPRLYSIKAPNTFYDTMYMPFPNRVITLGELLKIWENEEIFTPKCRKCGAKSLTYYFGGSPLSGNIFSKKSICTLCGHLEYEDKLGRMSEFRNARNKYTPIEPISPNPAIVFELIAICKGEKYIPTAEDKIEISVAATASTCILIR